jgi:transposase
VPNLLRAREVNDFAKLKREGLSIQAISSLTGFDRKTVRKYLRQPDGIPAYGPRPAAASKLKDWLQPQRETAGAVAVWRSETLPGRQAQVDWGHLGSLEGDSIERQLWAGARAGQPGGLQQPAPAVGLGCGRPARAWDVRAVRLPLSAVD